MRFTVIALALLVALPAFASSGCITLPGSGSRYCWNGNRETTVRPNGTRDVASGRKWDMGPHFTPRRHRHVRRNVH